MKRRLLPLFLLFILSGIGVSFVSAQSGPYGNEWIDYSKTYYKFKVSKNGVCRIYRPALDAAGVPASTTGSNFSLYRDGQEVPVWVSAETMGSGDYIEFVARKADGMLDKELYLRPEYQPNDRQSLFSDTACYYLTYDANSNHLRYQQAANSIPGGTLTPEPYQLATSLVSAKDAWNPGPSYAGSNELVSSQFDNGEGFVISTLYGGTVGQFGVTLAAPNLVAGIAATLQTSILARSFLQQHRVQVLVNNNLVADSSFGIAEAKRYNVSIPASQLSTSNSIQFVPISSGAGYDYLGVSFAELEYPRDFNMAGIDQGTFRLPATGASQYVEVTNLGAGRLYDVTARKWYNGNTAVSGKTRFYLDPSLATRDIVLLSDAATTISSLTPVKTIRFTNYSVASAQGDFVLISHTALMQPVSGRNYLQEYSAYRSSATGGAHTVVTADVNDLYDQFAYGYDFHPLSIKHFLRYAYEQWSVKPQKVLLVGRGIWYNQLAAYSADRVKYSYPIVPTYGHPGSDVDYVLFDADQSPKMQIGRLSVWNATEIGTYLNKIQAYEQALPPVAVPSLATELWKKRAMHVIGAQNAALQVQLEQVMNHGAAIIRDTFTGMSVTTIAKSLNNAIQAAQGPLVDSILHGGSSMITFFGHASTASFDYSLPQPESYSSTPRLPFFMALGCDVSQMFELSPTKTIAERYVLSPNGGSTSFLGSDYVSFTDFDENYLDGFYRSVAISNYGSTLGRHYNATHDSMVHYHTGGAGIPNYISIQLENMIFTGDPAVSLPASPKPDYYVGADGISAIPGNVSTSLDTFRLRINSFNLGKAIHDTVIVKVEHINPANVTTTVASYTVTDFRFTDSTTVAIPVNKVDDLGLNKYKVTVDAGQHYDEISELNNVATLELFIYSDNLIPIYPREFAIVHTPGVTLKASTLNPFRREGRYKIEIDTTALFNSTLKQQTTINSAGGVIKWTPSITMTDSVVYYWRTAFDSSVGGQYTWANSSFIYLSQSSDGWNQSHYYQFLKDNSTSLDLHPDRVFRFGRINHKLEVRNIILGGKADYNTDGADCRILWDDLRVEQSSYSTTSALQIMVIDSTTGRIWVNFSGALPGYPPPSATFHGLYSREFDMLRPASRMAAANFLRDSIADGKYVVVKNVWWHNAAAPSLIDDWKSDTLILGSGRSLYHSLYNMGFTAIDSYNKERAFVFMRIKGDPTYPIFQKVGDSLSSVIVATFNIKGSDESGQMSSTVIGPAKAWNAFKWNTFPYDNLPQNDTVSASIIGIDPSGNETMLYPKVIGDTSLAGIDARQYPNIKLVWNSKDIVTLSSAQLRYWRVLYSPVPEAALNPSIHYVMSDSLSQGQSQTFSTAIENLTPVPMDSMLVRFKIIGADGVTRQLADRRYRPLTIEGDTLHASITFDASPYPGKNFLFIEANPANDQPEQYHPNNLGYVPFRVGVDSHNPYLDVTFDGMHILNGDIINPKPLIKVRLKDENPYLALDDTALLKVSLRYPPVDASHQAVIVDVPFDGTVCRFVPAAKGTANNEASVEYKPTLTQDGIYQLIVSGADKSGNGAGTTAGAQSRSQYKIEFEVDSKPSITNILNYPNPFSTATAFVFTLTGSQVPSQLKIQILSVTGKVVREITRSELGPLHIGRNITEYQWDGRDQYGQLLGNGVYLYRVVTSLNGQDLELRTDADHSNRGDGIDKYFKNGYGKMYIMR